MTETEFKHKLDDALSKLADLFMAYYNPCGLNGTGCRVHNPNPCCINTKYHGKGLCQYLINGVCSHPNIECKSWFCDTALLNIDSKCKSALQALETIGKLYELIRPPYLGEKYYGCDHNYR